MDLSNNVNLFVCTKDKSYFCYMNGSRSYGSSVKYYTNRDEIEKLLTQIAKKEYNANLFFVHSNYDTSDIMSSLQGYGVKIEGDEVTVLETTVPYATHPVCHKQVLEYTMLLDIINGKYEKWNVFDWDAEVEKANIVPDPAPETMRSWSDIVERIDKIYNDDSLFASFSISVLISFLPFYYAKDYLNDEVTISSFEKNRALYTPEGIKNKLEERLEFFNAKREDGRGLST